MIGKWIVKIWWFFFSLGLMVPLWLCHLIEWLRGDPESSYA